jgi:uncharacterized lipoprotein YbaY
MLRPLLIAFCIFALAACSTATRPTTIEVSGTLFYLERIALPPDALVQVELRDVSQGTDKVLVVQAKSGEAGPPFPFKLSVPAPASDAQPSLALYASIRSSDRLIFATGAPVPIPAEGAAGLQVRLVMAPQTSSLTDQWLGKWIGPEGTFLILSKNGEKYSIQIQTLDGPTSYEGVGAGERIDFTRNGISQSIHAGDGKATGMKWLLDKSDCLIVQTGEGFCRG